MSPHARSFDPATTPEADSPEEWDALHAKFTRIQSSSGGSGKPFGLEVEMDLPQGPSQSVTERAPSSDMTSRRNLLKTAKGQEELARSENPDDRAAIFGGFQDVLVSADTFTLLATEDSDSKVRQQALGWATNHFAALDRVDFETFKRAVAASNHDDLYVVVGGRDEEMQTVQKNVTSLDRFNESWQARTARRELVYAVLATSPNSGHRLVAARGSLDTERLKSLAQDRDAEVASAAKMNPYSTRWSAVDVAADRLQNKFENLVDRIGF